MPTNYPTSKDTLSNPTSTDKENSASVPHAAQHANSNDAIEALETKVGIDSSSDTNSIDYFLKHASGTFESHNHSNNGAQIVTAGIADDAVGPTKIAETGWGASSKQMLNFVPRVASSSDFDVNDLTIDANWHELDLSSIVPTNCNAVLINTFANATTIDRVITYRTTLDDAFQIRGGIRTSTSETNYYSNDTIPVFNQKIEYRSAGTFNSLNIYVTGWWEPAHT